MSHIEPEEQTLTIESIIIHPYFSIKKPMDYDIALLKMDGAFHFGKHLGLTVNRLYRVPYNFCSIAHSLQRMLRSVCPTVLGQALQDRDLGWMDPSVKPFCMWLQIQDYVESGESPSLSAK